MKNTGKASEAEFERRLDALGKDSYYYRIKDAASIRGLTGRIGLVDKVPADYIIILNRATIFAEVKSTFNPTSFPFGLLKSGQNAHGLRILAAGGLYRVYVHRLTTDEWYEIPLNIIQYAKHSGHASLKWDDLSPLIWEFA